MRPRLRRSTIVLLALVLTACASRGPLTIEAVAIRANETLDLVVGVQTAIIEAEQNIEAFSEDDAARALLVVRRALTHAEAVPPLIEGMVGLSGAERDDALEHVQAIVLTLSSTLAGLRGIVPDAVVDVEALLVESNRLLAAVSNLKAVI